MTASSASTITAARKQQPVASLSAENKYILNCMIAGFTTTQIARSMGKTDSAIVQAVVAAGLEELAIATRVQRQTLASETDDLIGKIENRALKQLDLVVSSISDPVKLARTAQMLNGMKRRSQLEERQGGQDQGRIATIVLPVTVIQSHFKFNERNQAIEIDGRTLVATTGDALMKELGSQQQQLPRSEDLQRPPQEYQPNVPNSEGARKESSGRAVTLPSNFFDSYAAPGEEECFADLL